MDNHFEPLATGEVLSIDDSAQILIGHHTFRVGEFAEAIRKQLQSVEGWTKEKDAWFSEDGIPCEVLRFTANGWQKGKVRIHLEFCPQDFQGQPNDSSASVENASSAPSALVDTSEDELDLGESGFTSSDDLDLEDSPFAIAPSALVDSSDQLDLDESGLTSSDDLDLDDSAFTMNDDLGLEEDSYSLDNELDLEMPAVTETEEEEDAPSTVYVEVEREVIVLPGEQFEMIQTATSLDDDFGLGEISQSIDQELELEEASMPTEEELLDLGEMSLDNDDDLDFSKMSGSGEEFDFGDLSSGSDEDLDFGDISASGEDDFQFEDLSLNNESEGNENDSLLDDVWQDINQASWQNNH